MRNLLGRAHMRTFCELGDRLAHVLEAAHDVREGGGGPEVLLLEAEFFAEGGVVVWVEDGGDGRGRVGGFDGAFVVAGCKPS